MAFTLNEFPRARPRPRYCGAPLSARALSGSSVATLTRACVIRNGSASSMQQRGQLADDGPLQHRQVESLESNAPLAWTVEWGEKFRRVLRNNRYLVTISTLSRLPGQVGAFQALHTQKNVQKTGAAIGSKKRKDWYLRLCACETWMFTK